MTNTPTPQTITAANGERLPPDTLVNLSWLAHDSGMSEKWFYKLIARGGFMPPIKFGTHSRWRVGDYYAWIDQQRQQATELQAQRRAAYQQLTGRKKAAHRTGPAS